MSPNGFKSILVGDEVEPSLHVFELSSEGGVKTESEREHHGGDQGNIGDGGLSSDQKGSGFKMCVKEFERFGDIV